MPVKTKAPLHTPIQQHDAASISFLRSLGKASVELGATAGRAGPHYGHPVCAVQNRVDVSKSGLGASCVLVLEVGMREMALWTDHPHAPTITNVPCHQGTASGDVVYLVLLGRFGRGLDKLRLRELGALTRR